MKKIIAASLISAVLAVVPAVRASESVTCSTIQYGGAVCGIDTETKTTVTHDVTETPTGISDWSLVQVIAFAGISAAVATLLYKASYRWYILG